MVGQCVPYFVFREGDVHVVIKAMVEHGNRLLAQLCDARRAHGRGHRGQQRDAAKKKPSLCWGRFAVSRARICISPGQAWHCHYHRRDVEKCIRNRREWRGKACLVGSKNGPTRDEGPVVCDIQPGAGSALCNSVMAAVESTISGITENGSVV